MRRLITLGLAMILAIEFSIPAYAHYLWVNVDNFTPEAGEEITISMGWGHRFPEDEQLSASMLDELYIMDPQGKIIPLEIKPLGEEEIVSPVKIKLERPGTHLVVAKIKPGFMTITTEGHELQSKKGLQKAIKGYCYRISAKAIINVGQPFGNSFQKELNQRYQIIPLENPVNLKKDDYLSVKVILDGRPFSYSWVYATYAEFSPEQESFAYTTRADKEGVANVKILTSGRWLLLTSNEIPYPDSEEADVYYFTNTLTFEIK